MMSKVYDQLKIQIDTYLIPDLHFLNFSMGETVLVTTGNSVVKATFSYQLKTNLALLSLSQPLCLSLKTKVAISKKDNIKQSFQLAFIGTFVKGVQCKNFRLPDNYEEIVSGISQPEITIDYELNEVEKTSEAEQIKEIPDKVGDGEVVGDGDGEVVGESEYAILLKNFNFEKVSSIFKIPPPQVHREAKKTTIANIETILRSIYCFKGQNWIENSERLRKFLTSELISKQVRYTGDGQLLIDGIFQSKQIENLLHRYLTKYVICQTCSSPNTVLNRNNVQCQNCGVNHFLE